ncbi:hypothetical protein Fmac_012237 [Flemingia macrophylla]|uniref:Uncharacterized protein n=1 Tax=Flemingia macrophylla TaxID=520843 RepID=A0ABD1MPQ4_9FABA
MPNGFTGSGGMIFDDFTDGPISSCRVRVQFLNLRSKPPIPNNIVTRNSLCHIAKELQQIFIAHSIGHNNTFVPK